MKSAAILSAGIVAFALLPFSAFLGMLLKESHQPFPSLRTFMRVLSMEC